MKLMIASDIHGSAYYCREMFRVFEEERAERLILLGDLLYHGPRNNLPKEYEPREVIRMLNERKDKLFCVRGNCEAEVDQMVLEFPVMAEYMLLYLDGRLVFATHGHIHNEQKLPPLGKNAALLHGHTHVPAIADRGNYLYLNPGSVSLPKEGSRHSYMVYEDGSYIVKGLLDGKVLLS